jgi:hypothetical protein
VEGIVSVHLNPLAAALLRAAAEGRLLREEGVYLWRPRNAVTRAISSPGMAETGTQLVAFGLVLPPEHGTTTVTITQRGRDALAAHTEGGPAVADNQPPKPEPAPAPKPAPPSSADNPGRALGKELAKARQRADAEGRTGRSR